VFGSWKKPGRRLEAGRLEFAPDSKGSPLPQPMQFTPTQKQAAAWSMIGLALALVLWLLAPVLTPFLVAAVLAYALTPLVDWLDDLGRGRIPRVLAVAVVELLFLVSLLALVLLIVPILSQELPAIRDQIPVLAETLNQWLKPRLAELGMRVSLDVASIKAFLIKYVNANFEDGMASLLVSLRIGGSVALAILGNLFLIPVALFYMLMDWRRIVGLFVSFVPPRLRGAYDRFTDEADQVLGQYLRGQLLVMLLLAAYYSIGLWLFGLDLALPIGTFTGLAMFIPYVGFAIGLILAILAGLLQFGSVKVLVMVAVVYGSGQILEGFFLTPRLVGERIGLHPLAVIFALLAFGQLLGFVGVLIALPASAVLLVGIRRLRESYMASRLYQG